MFVASVVFDNRNFWQTSEGTLDATGGGDAGIRGATLLAASVDGGARLVSSAALTGARLVSSIALVISMGLPGATRVWLQACVLAMIWIRDGLRCLKDLVFKFRHAARSIAPSSPSVPPPSPPPLCDPPF